MLKSDPGYVYFARAKSDASPVKIGWSTNPWGQAHEGQRWTWFDLEIVATIEIKAGHALWGTRFGSLERLLHDALSADHIAREWFRPSAAVLEAINMAQRADADAVARWAARRAA